MFRRRKKVLCQGKTYRYEYPRWGRMRMSGLHGRDAMSLEHECLRRLSEATCYCGAQGRHFPVVLAYDYRFRQLATVDMGPTLIDQPHNVMSIPLFSMQIACICRALREQGVYHLDLNRSNVCVSSNGTIGLIDFELAVINGDPASQELSDLYDRVRSDHVAFELKCLFI